MKLKSNTIVLLAIALILTGSIYVWERQQTESSAGSEESAGTALFSFKEADITKVTVQNADQATNQALVLERSPQGWRIQQPEAGPADEASITFLLNTLATGQAQRTLEISPSDVKDYGLDQPQITVTIQLQNQSTYKIALGRQTFDLTQVYAQIEPTPNADKTADNGNADKLSIALVETGFLDAVNRPLAEWKPQPNAPTSSPELPDPVDGAPLPTPAAPGAE